MDAKVTKAFDLYAKDYDNWFKSPEGQVLFPMELKAVKSVIKNDLIPPFLEVGVGTGVFASVMGTPFGIDTAFNMLTIAKIRGISVALAKGECLPFKDKSFGTIFIILTLCFVENPLKVLKEAKRVLKPEGKIALCFINKKSRWGSLYIKKKNENHPVYGEARFFSYLDVMKFLDKINFRIINCTSTLLQPPSESLYCETPEERLLSEAGFICLLAER